MLDLDWAEVHGYTQRCAACGQLCDSTFCSNRCMLDFRFTNDQNVQDEEPESPAEGAEE